MSDAWKTSQLKRVAIATFIVVARGMYEPKVVASANEYNDGVVRAGVIAA